MYPDDGSSKHLRNVVPTHHTILRSYKAVKPYKKTLYKEKRYKIVPVTNLTKMSKWTKSYKEGKIKIILVENTKENTMPDGELVLQ